MLRLPKLLTDVLAEAREWHVDAGSKHFKLMVNGQLAGILPKTGRPRDNSRELVNTRAQIRRIIRLQA
jgi:hypothetical protein